MWGWLSFFMMSTSRRHFSRCRWSAMSKICMSCRLLWFFWGRRELPARFQLCRQWKTFPVRWVYWWCILVFVVRWVHSFPCSFQSKNQMIIELIKSFVKINQSPLFPKNLPYWLSTLNNNFFVFSLNYRENDVPFAKYVQIRLLSGRTLWRRSVSIWLNHPGSPFTSLTSASRLASATPPFVQLSTGSSLHPSAPSAWRCDF